MTEEQVALKHRYASTGLNATSKETFKFIFFVVRISDLTKDYACSHTML